MSMTKNPTANASQSTPDDLVQLILEAHEDGDFERVRKNCETLRNVGEPEDRLIALQYAGLSFYEEKRYSEALPLLRQAAEEGKGIQDYFNLLMAATYDRQRFLEEKTLALLTQALTAAAAQNQLEEELSEGFIRFHYCRGLDDMGRFADARRQLDLLLRIYAGLKSRDDKTCKRLGLPRFSQFRRTAEDVFSNLGLEDDELESWIEAGIPETGMP